MDAVGDILVALGKFCVVMMLIVSAWWDHKDKRTGNNANRSYGGFTGFGGGCGGAGGGCSSGGGGC